MSLTTVTNNLSITIPKQVRDNMGLVPYDCVSFEADDQSYYVNKVACSNPSDSQEINEVPASYDVQPGSLQVSSAAKINLPGAVVDVLKIEPGSVVGLFRDLVGYRLIHVFAPTEGGVIPEIFGRGSEVNWPNSFDDVALEYSVQVTREGRRERFYDLEQVNKADNDEPFTNVNEPPGDSAILDAIQASTAATRH